MPHKDVVRFAVVLLLSVVLTGPLHAAALRIAPPDGARFLVDQRFDVRVEVDSPAALAGVKLYLDGRRVRGEPPSSGRLRPGSEPSGALARARGRARAAGDRRPRQRGRVAIRDRRSVQGRGARLGGARRRLVAARRAARAQHHHHARRRHGRLAPHRRAHRRYGWPQGKAQDRLAMDSLPGHRHGDDGVAELDRHRLGARHVELRDRQQGEQQPGRRLRPTTPTASLRQPARRVPVRVPAPHARASRSAS